ncbi:MAG: helix-turn-helix domain-containing protein [Candidatus Marinimicrobia bacterium]|nr:helix-turn-helix domain-containing protein [Candidatus Neomarinimicrobiota bacterium]
MMTNADKSGQLSPEQERAIALILTGQTDQVIADAVGVTRQTVNGWRNHHANFMAVLNQQRATIWEAHVERLRGLATGAIDTLADALQDDDPKEQRAAAVHILKACGLYGKSLQPLGMIDAAEIEYEAERAQKERAMDALLMSW